MGCFPIDELSSYDHGPIGFGFSAGERHAPSPKEYFGADFKVDTTCLPKVLGIASTSSDLVGDDIIDGGSSKKGSDD